MLKATLTICILAAYILNCQAKNCCYPDQFESTLKHVSITADKTGRSFLSTTKTAMSFDTVGKRIYYHADIYVDNKTESTVQLQLYEKGVQYTVVNNKTCSKARLQPWKYQNCIPDYAVKLPPFTLGMDPSLEVQDYYWKLGSMRNTLTVTSETCVPVFVQFYGGSPGGKSMGLYKFENVTCGIKNQHVFDVPDICKHIQVTEEIATRRPIFPF